MTNEERPFVRPSRRMFMRAAAGAGLFGGASVIAAAQEQTLEFDCGMRGWQGTAPSNIQGEVNPTLELEPGETYTIEWTNVDGFEHNFVVLDREGDELIRTDTIEDAGQTQIVRFTATEEMTQYICEIHPETMRGDISIAGRDEDPNPYDGEAVAPPGGSLGLEKIADGLNAPLGFETAPGVEDQQFVVDQTGQIYALDNSGLREEPFLDISGRIVDLGIEEGRGYDERGLLGLAFHPDFQENQRFFVRYSAPRREGTPEAFDHTEVLSEFEATGELESGDAGSERTFLEIPSTHTNHNGGSVLFGPDDGYLYTSIGDGGNADDVGTGHVDDWYGANDGGNGQDVTENLLGSILRINVDSQDNGPYAIPADNPLVGEDGLDEHYAWGFRNPWRMSFDSEGRLFVSDAMQNRFEEVNIVEKGGNYGWNVKEGTHCFSTDRPSAPADELEGCPDSTPDNVRGGEELRDPVIEFPHRFRTTASDSSVVIGGHVYEGDAIEHLQGTYVFGNWSGRGIVEPDGEIFAATDPSAQDSDGNGTATADNPSDENATNGTQTLDDGIDGGTSDAELWQLEELVIEGAPNGELNRYVYAFGQDRDGELYVLTNTGFQPGGDTTGEVYKLVPPGEGDQIPDR